MGKPAEWPVERIDHDVCPAARNGICGAGAVGDMGCEHGYRTDSR